MKMLIIMEGIKMKNKIYIVVLFVCMTGCVPSKKDELRKLIETKSTNELNNTFNSITNIVKIDIKQFESLKEIFVIDSFNRNESCFSGTKESEGATDSLVIQWIQENFPNIDTNTFNNLQNIIISSRDSWTMQQKELINKNKLLNH